MESRKRKREDSEPRIKYHVQQLSRSFERILKENSREELCEVVRKKLDLDSKTNLELVQVRDGVLYDLEDDDDFEAFKAAAHAYSSLDVRVSFLGDAIPQNVSNTRGVASSIPDTSTNSLAPENVSQNKAARKRFSMSDSESGNRDLVPGVSSDVDDQDVERERSNPVLSSFSEEIVSPPKKKRKKVHIDSGAVASEVHGPKKRGKNKQNDSINQVPDSIFLATNEAQEPPRKKRKEDKDTGPEVPGPLVDEAQPETPGPSDTTNTKMKKSKSLKGDKEMLTEGDFTKELFANTSMSANATSESEPPSRSLGSHDPQADPGASTSDVVRHTYASFLSQPRTASEILANYSGSISKKRPQSKPLAAGHVVKNAVTTTKAKTAAEAEKTAKNTDVDVAKASGTKKPKPKLGKSRLSESWVPMDTEESPLSLSIKDPSETDSSKVPDAAAPPQPLDKSSSAVSQIHPPRNPKTKNLITSSKLASPCPICLSRPFHSQSKCPLINSGEDAILDRIAQLEAEGGHGDVISELREWVPKVREKSTSKYFATQETEPSHSKIDKSEHRGSPLPSWAPVVSLQSHPSEVIVESTNEGSESASSGSSAEEDVQSESGSSSDDPSSSSRSRSISFTTNLEQVDLDALIRGPSLKNVTLDLSKLDDDIEELESKSDSEDNGVEGDTGWLEEQEEEQEHRLPKYPKRGAFLRSRSSEEVASDEEDDSASSVGEKAAMVEGNPQLSTDEEEIEPSVAQDTTGGNEVLQDPSTMTDDHICEQVLTHVDPVIQEGRHATPAPVAVPESSPTPAATPAVNAGNSSEAISIELVKEVPPVTPAKIPSDQDPTSGGLSHADTQLTTSRPSATTPIRSNMTPFKAVVVPQTPGTARRMKDRTGNLPLNPPDDEIGMDQSAFQSPEKIIQVKTKEKDNSMEKFQRRSTRRSTQSMSTPKPSLPQSDTGLSSTKSVSVNDVQRGPSLPSTQPIPTAKRSVPRSDTGLSSARSMSADDVSPASQLPVKRRGRPRLTEAVKAERLAMREAQKAARAAEKREKNELKKTGRNDSSLPKNREDDSVEKEVPSEEVSVSPLPAVTTTTPIPMSQWTSLPPVLTSPSTVSLSSPAVDELVSSTESKRKGGSVVPSNYAGAPSRSSPAPTRLNGVRSPGSISLTSGSRRHDEEDVEQMVVSSEVGAAKVSGAATQAPLFLPGASEMSQSQAVPGFVALSMPEATDEDERRTSPSGSSSASEGPSTKASTVPHAQAVSKAAFPSLSQLSFDKFKPSFLLTSVFSQGQGTRRGVRSAEVHPESGEEDGDEDEDEDEDDDESSGTERESSHVPKDKRAGVNMPARRTTRSRGLLH